MRLPAAMRRSSRAKKRKCSRTPTRRPSKDDEPADEPDLKPVPVPSDVGGGGIATRQRGVWDRHRYKIVAEGEEDIADHLFDLAMDHGWRMSELTKEEVSLEQVFRKLTIREGHSDAA